MVFKNINKNNLVLTGFMATGKTKVAQILAEWLDRNFIDTDRLIEEAVGLSVPDIFEKYGETYFRDRESEAVEKLLSYKPGSLVAATGGGVVLREKNRILLKMIGPVILLKATPEEIYRRIYEPGRQRPLLKGPDPAQRIKNLLEQREYYYRHCDIEIDTTAKTPRQVVSEILSCFI